MQKQTRVTVVALLALAVALAAMVGGWWFFANQIPTYSAPAAVLPSPNAYDDYQAAAALLSPDVPVPGGNNRTRPGQLPPILAKNRPALKRLRRGFSHPYLNPPLVSATQSLPELDDFRRLAGLLVQEGKSAEAGGRLREAANSYLDCLRLGSDIPRGGTLRHAMTSVAIHELALPPLYALVERLDAQPAGEALSRMRQLDAQPLPFAQVLTRQRDVDLTLFPALLRNSTAEQLGRKLGYGPDPVMSATYLLTPKREMLERYRRYMDASIRRTAGPFVGAAPLPEVPHDPFNQWLTPASDNAWCWWLERDAAWRVAETRLALRVYRARHHGKSPSTLTELVPGLLRAVPEDPFVRQPLVYHAAPGEPHVYSRGADGDDDGGRLLDWPRRGSDGDVTTMRQIR